MVTSTLRQSIADRRAKQGDKGFTLIELLVVVLIIGILAAIAIPVFLGQQNSARDAAARSDASNLRLAVIGYYSDNNTGADPSAALLTPYGYAASAANTVVVKSTSASAFCISVTSATGTIFKTLAASTTIATATAACTSVTN